MNTYNVYMPPATGPESDIANALYLPDNKAWLAVIIPPVWFIWHRLWWGLAVYLAFLTVIFLLLLTPMRNAVPFLSAIPGLFLFLEGHELVRQKFENKGWWQIGVVQANNEEDAELRYNVLYNSDVRTEDQIAKSVPPVPQKDNPVSHLKFASVKNNKSSSSISMFPMDDSA